MESLYSKDKDIEKKRKEFEDEAIPHMNLLYNFARRLTGNEADAFDLLQDTYFKAFKFWDKYEKGTNIRAWLFRIMKNSYINKYRKDIREYEVVDFDEIEEFYTLEQAEISIEDDVEKKYFDNLLEDKVLTAIDELPVDFRTVIILCDIEGLTYEEIAEILDIPIGTVRSRIHRARKVLQKVLIDYAKKKGIIK